MQKRIRIWNVSAIALALATLPATAWPQSEAPPPPDQGSDVIFHHGGGPMGPAMPDDMILGFGMELGGKVVTGAPFSAQTTLETMQTLADGNRMHRVVQGAIFRDNQGRVRHEGTPALIGPFVARGNPPQMIFINDPVAGAHYVLEPDQKIARKMTPPPGFGKEMQQHFREHMSANGKPGVATESLGTQEFDGVRAEGTRIARTIPAGEIGNEQPIQVVVERWYSPELQTTVMLKRDDPRTGETVFKLTNISRQVPDASLFQVPPDYTITEGGPGHMFHMEKPVER